MSAGGKHAFSHARGGGADFQNNFQIQFGGVLPLRCGFLLSH